MQDLWKKKKEQHMNLVILQSCMSSAPVVICIKERQVHKTGHRGLLDTLYAATQAHKGKTPHFN